MVMRELSLFTGAGGGLLASHLLGFTPVQAVEIDPYCRQVLRIRFPGLPVHDDIRTFDGRPFRGTVDVITGGFPCQAFSHAAHGNNTAPNLWPEMLRVVLQVEPRFVFAENVTREAINAAADSLEALGYHTRCAKVSSSDVGAPVRRNRYWLVARTHCDGQPSLSGYEKVANLPQLAGSFSWPDPPGELGVVDGMAHRMDRLRALGNGQVPAVAATAFRVLLAALEHVK